MCIYANIVDIESFRCLELKRSTRDKEAPAPASLSWKNSFGGRKVEKDTAVAFSIDTGDAMDYCLDEDVMDWTAFENSSDCMEWESESVCDCEVVDMQIDEEDDCMEFELVCDCEVVDMQIDEEEDFMSWELVCDCEVVDMQIDEEEDFMSWD
jgi:hypothetical protein